MARLVLPSRLELKRPEGSSNAAPLAKVSFTTLLYVSPVQMMPACSHTGTPLHFLDHLGVGLLDQTSDPSERLAPPIIQRRDSRIDELRGRVTVFSSEPLFVLFVVVVAFFMAVVRPTGYSDFPPNIMKDPFIAPFVPMNGDPLKEWLLELRKKK
jgi:hypothetical protein